MIFQLMTIMYTKEERDNMYQVITNYDNGKRYEEGDFSFVANKHTAAMFSDHWIAVNELNLQEFFKKRVDNYMCLIAPELDVFSKHPLVDVKYGHSGFSFALVCRQMQNIVQKGWENYVKSIITSYRYE